MFNAESVFGLNFHLSPGKKIQCNLDLVTMNLVTTSELVTILQRSFFNLLHKIIRFSDRPKVSLNRDCTVLLCTETASYFLKQAATSIYSEVRDLGHNT